MSKLTEQGLTVSMVKAALKAANGNVGALCTHSAINMWSRKKPVIYPGIPASGRWWEGSRRNGGILIPEISRIPADIEAANWSYERPFGGANAPYRLGDFRGYNPDAVPLVSRAQSVFSVDPTTSKMVDVEFQFINDDGSYPDNLNTGDITSPYLQDLCLACAITDSKGVVVKTVENDGYLYINSLISLDVSDLSLGEYKLYFYLVNEYRTKKYALWKSSAMPNPATLSITGNTGSTYIMYVGWDYNEGYFLPASEVDSFQKVVKGDYICFLISLYNDTATTKVFESKKFGCRMMCLGYADEAEFTAHSVMTGGWKGTLGSDGYASGHLESLPASFSLQPGEGRYMYIQIEPCWILDYNYSGIMDLVISLTYNGESLMNTNITFKSASGGFE